MGFLLFFFFSSFFLRQRIVVQHVICADLSQLKLERITGVFPWGCLGTAHTALWQALPCSATSKKILNYPRCQLHPARWSGIFLFRFQTDPAKMALSHQLYVTHHKTMSLRSGSFEWLLSRKCATISFLKRSGRGASIFINLWNRDLAVTERLVSSAPGSAPLPPALENPSSRHQRHLVQNSMPRTRISPCICWNAKGQIC